MSRNQEETENGLIESMTEAMRSTGARTAELAFNVDKLCVNVRVVVCDLNYHKQ